MGLHELGPQRARVSERVRVVRADDLLVCEFELVAMEVTGSVPARQLTHDASGAAPIVVVHLPPQHVAEAVFDQSAQPSGLRFIGSRAAKPSRVAFSIDRDALPIAYTLSAILKLLSTSRLAVVNSAARAPTPGRTPDRINALAVMTYLLNPPVLEQPGAAETAIELPFRLILSPEREAGFSHLSTPAAGPTAGRVELWHSLLQPAPDRAQREVRAIWMRQGSGPPWNPGQPEWGDRPAGDQDPFPLNTMSQRERSEIVHLSGNRSYTKSASTYKAQPITVRRLALSSLGAWLDSRGDWDPPEGIDLVEWTHRATQGRDHFVRIVKIGFLYPFGHLAAKIKVSERKFTDEPGHPPVLLQREFIVVREPSKTFEPGAAPKKERFTMPFREVRLRTLVTPDLKVPPAKKGEGPSCFLIVPSGQTDPLQFKLTGTDAQGNTLDLATPLVWIDSTSAWDAATIEKASGLYAGKPGKRSVLEARGASLALGPSLKGEAEATYTADTVTFSAPPRQPMAAPTWPPGPGDKQPGFWPKLVRAEVRAPALEIVAGVGGKLEIAYHKSYELDGFGGANPNELIAEILGDTKPNLDFGNKGDRAGGLIKPSMSVSGLSRALGPVGGPAAELQQIAAGHFKPASFFAGTMAPKLFGVFTLDQVLAEIKHTQLSDMPQMVTKRDGDSLIVTQHWKPVLQSFPPPPDPLPNPALPDESVFKVDDATRMEVVATFDPRSQPPTSDVRATLWDFTIRLLGKPTFIELDFKKVEFAAMSGRKPDVDVVLGDVRFVGPLSFVEEIKKLIPLDGFSDPPALEVTPSGIKSSFSLALPDLAVGVFSLQNLTLSAGFEIPFVEGPLTVSFQFCAREEPFLLTVSLFGGGGFFGLSIDPNGVRMLEAALEFGASVAINLGVAQGGVQVMAGIYFKLESGKGCTLTGYFRLCGNMSVLGLISASIELCLSLTYKEVGKASGSAVVTVEIDIFLFSMSVKVECERQFAGKANDPTFQDLMCPYPDAAGETIEPWREYCEAYA